MSREQIRGIARIGALRLAHGLQLAVRILLSPSNPAYSLVDRLQAPWHGLAEEGACDVADRVAEPRARQRGQLSSINVHTIF